MKGLGCLRDRVFEGNDMIHMKGLGCFMVRLF